MQETKPQGRETWESYRSTLVDKTLHAFYLLAWVGLPVFIWRGSIGGFPLTNLLTIFLVISGMCFYKFGKDFSTDVKGAVLVGAFFGLSAPGLLTYGVASNGLLLIASGCLCSSLVFSKRTSIWLCIASFVLSSLIGIGYVSGILELRSDANIFITSAATWITAIGINFLSVLILVARIGNFSRSVQLLLLQVEQQRDLIAHQANHDQLTNLPTLRLATDRLEMSINTAKRNGSKVALMFIDLDGFKKANDTFGHDAGDHVLQEVARRISSIIRAADTACRIGGDEFLVILGEIAEQSAAAVAAGKIIQTINQPINFNGQPIEVGCSIGIALFPDNANDSKQLRLAADAAMYSIKRSGKNNFAFCGKPVQHSPEH